MSKLSTLIAAVLLMSLPLRAQEARDIPEGDQWFSGLTGYRAFAVTIIATSAGASVDSARLRQRVELKLRQNGIAVLSDSMPILAVVCHTLTNSSLGMAAYTCSLQVRDMLVRSQPSPLRVNAGVYQSFPSVGTVAKAQLDQACRDNVDRLLDEFLNDWYKANPKK